MYTVQPLLIYLNVPISNNSNDMKILVGFRAATDNCFKNAFNPSLKIVGQNTAYVNFV